jgi:hypothetical protein
MVSDADEVRDPAVTGSIETRSSSVRLVRAASVRDPGVTGSIQTVVELVIQRRNPTAPAGGGYRAFAPGRAAIDR